MRDRRVVIIGGGFAGISVAKRLVPYGAKVLDITVIDERPAHVYTPWLYEVASAVTPKDGGANIGRARSAADIPYKKLPGFHRVRFRNEHVESIDKSAKQVVCKGGQTIPYDILVVAVGATSFDFGVPGVKTHALSLKTAEDATHIAKQFAALLHDVKEGRLGRGTIVIVGGGANGVELTGEVASVRAKFLQERKLDPGKVRILLCNSGPELVPMFPKPVRRSVERRLKNLHVEVMNNVAVTSVAAGMVETKTASIPCDLLVWAAGVASRPEPAVWKLPVNDRGRILVDDAFAVQGCENIFALGDCAARYDARTKQPDPQSAQVACAQAPFVARNILRTISKQPLAPFKVPTWQVLLAVGGKFGVGSVFGVAVAGRFAYLMRRLVDLKYFISVFPPIASFKTWYYGVEIYAENDPR